MNTFCLNSLILLTAIFTSCSKHKPTYAVKEVVLTFDDAPNFPENTSQILDILNKYEVNATFFCIGKYLKKYPVLAKRLSKEQTLGNHTFSHICIGKSDINNIYNNEILENQIIIDSLQPNNKRYFRPPFGNLKSHQKKFLKNKGYEIVMWDLSAEEWDDKVTTNEVVNYFNQHLCKVAKIPILLFHLNKSTIESLEILLNDFQKKKIKIISLDEYMRKTSI